MIARRGSHRPAVARKFYHWQFRMSADVRIPGYEKDCETRQVKMPVHGTTERMKHLIQTGSFDFKDSRDPWRDIRTLRGSDEGGE